MLIKSIPNKLFLMINSLMHKGLECVHIVSNYMNNKSLAYMTVRDYSTAYTSVKYMTFRLNGSGGK